MAKMYTFSHIQTETKTKIMGKMEANICNMLSEPTERFARHYKDVPLDISIQKESSQNIGKYTIFKN